MECVDELEKKIESLKQKYYKKESQNSSTPLTNSSLHSFQVIPDDIKHVINNQYLKTQAYD